VVGARSSRTTTGAAHEIRARWVVLATGAVPQALMAAGLCERHTPSGVALRGYVRHDGLVGRITRVADRLAPAPARRLRLDLPGAGRRLQHRRGPDRQPHRQRGNGKGQMQDVNLRQMFDAFCEVYAPGRTDAPATPQGAFQGRAAALLAARRTLVSRPGLLATGEAIGSTYAFSGEGIGKAMETGLLAAEALLAHRRAPKPSRARLTPPRWRACSRASTSTKRPAASTCTPGSPTW
jgi:flavin-dependent dehydrogenase